MTKLWHGSHRSALKKASATITSSRGFSAISTLGTRSVPVPKPPNLFSSFTRLEMVQDQPNSTITCTTMRWVPIQPTTTSAAVQLSISPTVAPRSPCSIDIGDPSNVATLEDDEEGDITYRRRRPAIWLPRAMAWGNAAPGDDSFHRQHRRKEREDTRRGLGVERKSAISTWARCYSRSRSPRERNHRAVKNCTPDKSMTLCSRHHPTQQLHFKRWFNLRSRVVHPPLRIHFGISSSS